MLARSVRTHIRVCKHSQRKVLHQRPRPRVLATEPCKQHHVPEMVSPERLCSVVAAALVVAPTDGLGLADIMILDQKTVANSIASNRPVDGECRLLALSWPFLFADVRLTWTHAQDNTAPRTHAPFSRTAPPPPHPRSRYTAIAAFADGAHASSRTALTHSIYAPTKFALGTP
jgi:hypothetical protein